MFVYLQILETNLDNNRQSQSKLICWGCLTAYGKKENPYKCHIL